MLLIGSRAARALLPNFRTPKDYDLICSKQEFYDFIDKNKPKKILIKTSNKIQALCDNIIFEFELIHNNSSSMLYHQFINNSYKDKYISASIPDLKSLYLLKKSHITYNIHWDKNINDYHYLKNNIKDFTFEQFHKDFYFKRSLETRKRLFKKQNSKSNKDNHEFFEHYNIKRYIEHDKLHEIVAFYDKPLFYKLKKHYNSAEVYLDLFNNLSFKDKIKCIQEECFVLSLERIIIPEFIVKKVGFTHLDFLNSYKYVLKRISTNLKDNPTWIRDFAIENHINILNFDLNKILYKIKDLWNII